MSGQFDSDLKITIYNNNLVTLQRPPRSILLSQPTFSYRIFDGTGGPADSLSTCGKYVGAQ
jgi:hypothetical protein